MEYIGTLIVLLAVVFFFLYNRYSDASKSAEPVVEATYVCDDCGENECVCRKSED